ncbi:AraC family transcriptional regulator [Antribacter gilvus]|uniref:AraC family transcriptional regulator n=1 Tax=Antribacter gilvus TaxID=2304675 RepID=UPI001981DA8B|nr:AraC family transcriptional regulator [Antribacter gilvus]
MPHPLPHAHDFLVLGLVVSGGGALRIDGQARPLRAGDLFLVAPGDVVEVDEDAANLPTDVRTIFFPPDAIEPGALRSWRAHPLLFPFVRGHGTGVQLLPVPEPDRARFAEGFQAIDRELQDRRDGYGEAALAHLTLVLVDVARITADLPGSLRWRDEPLLADVFEVIESRYTEAISLRDVASAVGLTPAHLTTVVRRKTGRTVQQWIAERRMGEARRLLAGTDLTIASVGTRVGFRDAGYFARTFRREHGTTPALWRAAERAADIHASPR